MTTLFEDVGAFHEKFGLPHAGELRPAPLSADLVRYRGGFLLEELAEWFHDQGAEEAANRLRELIRDLQKLVWRDAPMEGLAGSADALADLVYVALGTAHLSGLPFDAHWAEVQRANMAKERATGADDARSKRGHALDVVKPAGWRGPDHWPILLARALR